MHETHDQRAYDLVRPQSAQHAIQSRERGCVVGVSVGARPVAMGVGVHVVIVAVGMGVDPGSRPPQ
jgi:hypothetical protein